MPPKRKLKQEPADETAELLEVNGTATNGVNGDAAAPTKKRRTKKESIEATVTEEQPAATPKRSRATKVKVEVEEEEEAVEGAAPSLPKRKRKVKEEIKQEEEVDGNGEVVEKTAKKKRKTKEERDAEMIPLASRTLGHRLFIGAHVSAAGGVHNAIANSVHIGANAFALFLKSQRKWANPPLLEDVASSFHEKCGHHSYTQSQHVVPHGSYLVNLAHTDKARTAQAYDSYLDDLKRCEALGIKLYNIHPGNTAGNDRAVAIQHLASNINRAHQETKSVITLLENMAADNNTIGTTFEDLRDIISHVENKERIGVCIDTCHAFAAGYDLRTPETFKSTFDQFSSIVGFQYLRALHINDSKAPLSSHRDLHANIGTGFLGLRAFHNLVNDPRFEGLPLVLETPIEVRDDEGNLVKDEKGKEKEDKGIWAREIKMLEGMVGMDVEGEEFLKMEAELSRKGEPERKRVMEQVEKKKEKDSKKAEKGSKKAGQTKGKRKGKVEESESELSDEEV
ncbi:Apurinic-apyrimidinic endonuclease 1 [Fulvia fulva]|uniref:Apurinic-apyrimidinic endonuclease 1 n=1 Tax=Passalora fulva TaxID=5499 RepID=A0A9Q8UTP3_PASFU|nr:Apurinic-apyrimidinic endonuclease 1 [Fulvia fulva]KAK4614142.1 Apurinic-apyrimidinic endonuclease 1 [Fulvia fulva]KAK4614590.1 Apurinic-apyrimidinic endonuclease 1 [Fulvia fulva]UJO22134.1 Apurinic-apyrimidinic endonuclease 1 [Fulvia fulva]WPV20513.1 Apurinic-apyrimidinic endonuclease 1 [Fulvia fulva]WPV35052.1 Apurinic-apyrimidinic endonuclease 1 [Fulvia fulva]